MKPCFEKQPSSSESSTNGSHSKYDQETGFTPILSSINEDVAVPSRISFFLFFPHDMDLNPARMVIAEMVGTFTLMLCVRGVVACTVSIEVEVGLMEYATAGGLTIIVLIFSIGPISGSHINPAVTIAYASIGQIPLSKETCSALTLFLKSSLINKLESDPSFNSLFERFHHTYAQVLGSVLGTYIGKSVYSVKCELMATQPLHGCASAFWVELLATFILMFLVASLTAEEQSFGKISEIVVGVAIVLLVLISSPISGGSLNPARLLGPAIVSWNFSNIWIYIVAPVTGAVGGGLLNRFLRLQPRPCTSTPSLKTSLLDHNFIQKTYECT